MADRQNQVCERSVGKPRLGFGQKFAYSVGHVLNDLTASMWFTYMIIYFHQVKNFDNGLAGDLVLIGQVSDAIFTPFIGFESDRTKGIWKLGKRKTWHLVGSVCVAASFPFLFVGCIHCMHSPDWSQFIYYAPFVVIFQFGWASTQINHLSLIPDLTDDSHERVGLNGTRYAFTVLSNMIVYAIAFVIFEVQHTSSSKLDSSDSGKFKLLVLIVVGIGILFSTTFHLGVREHSAESHHHDNPDAEKDAMMNTIEASTMAKLIMTWKCWLKESQFYQVAMIYMSTRLVVNVSQVYLPMFITETIELDKSSIAIIPFVVYISGFITSLLMRLINRVAGRKITYVIGIVFSIGGSCVFYFIPVGSKLVYGGAVLLGIGGSTMLVTSLAMTADLISGNTESGAFVYGAMSFTDKLSNGAAIALIQQFHPCKTGCCPACKDYYRNIMSFVPAGCAVLAFIALLTLIPVTLGTRRKKLAALVPVAANGHVPEPSGSSDESEPLLSGRKEKHVRVGNGLECNNTLHNASLQYNGSVETSCEVPVNGSLAEKAAT